jgi:hypothetical protein
VRSTDERFLELLRGHLGRFRVDEVSDDATFQVDCGTQRALPGGKVLRPIANLYLGRLRIFCGPRWEDMAGRLISGVRDMVTTHSNEFVRLRAVGAVIGERALILPSPPNPHLPALAAMLVRSGAGYLGDEVVNLDPILRRIHGLSLPILVDVSDLGHFPEANGRARRLPREERPEGSDSRTPRRPIPVELLGGHPASPAELGWIVLPSFSPGETTRIEPVTAAEGVFRLVEAMLNSHIWGERALILARDLVETVPVSRLIIGSLPDAAELLMGLKAEVAPA